MKDAIQISIDRADIDDFGAVINDAVRYCIGRRTYMPDLVTSWIMKYCHGILTKRTIAVILRDIDEATKEDGLGDPCDAVTWERFRDWASKEVPLE